MSSTQKVRIGVEKVNGNVATIIFYPDNVRITSEIRRNVNIDEHPMRVKATVMNIAWLDAKIPNAQEQKDIANEFAYLLKNQKR